jgi:hypothetical protein
LLRLAVARAGPLSRAPVTIGLGGEDIGDQHLNQRK